MSKIKSTNTGIEKICRKILRNAGYNNYIIKNRILGKPDIFFPKKRIAIFIDGCFWHGCKKCFRRPKTNSKYWDKKIKNNILRDRFINKELRKQKIQVIRVWEHDIKKNPEKFINKFKKIYEKT
jgi:DNA mismatch endonuclease (patch repair protein)